MAKKKWRRRTHGTARQIGQAFPVEESSMQSRKANLPRISENRQSRLRRMFDNEEREKEKRLKELAEKKKHEKHMMGQPIEEYEEPTVDEQIRAEAGEVKKVVMEINYDTKSNLHRLSDWLRQTRIGRFFERKKEEKESKLPNSL